MGKDLNKTTSHPHNFLGLPPQFTQFERSEFVILPVPYEQTTTYRVGTKDGPQAIISASQEVETFDEELKFEAYHAGICTLDPLEITAAGPERMIEKVYQATRKLLSKGKILVMLGGEHTISIGAVKAFKESYPYLSVLQMDAHADLRDSYQENRFSHACVMRRLGELLPCVGVGIRSLCDEEYKFILQERIKVFFAQELRNNSRWKEMVLEKLSPDVYLTLDLDVFDPSIMPSVGTPEPGGFLWHEMTDFLKVLIHEKNLVGFDMVELSPIPGLVAPDFLVAKLIYKIISYMADKKRNI